MDKSTIVLRTNFKGILNEFFKKFIVVLIMAVICIAANKLKQYVAKKFNLTNSIFDGDLLGTVSMILVYVVLAILLILLFIALGRMFALFYELKRVTTIDFAKERIVIQKYDFPFEKEIEEKKFNRIVGIEIAQKSIDRAVKCGSLYVEYLVQSKNDSKLRGFEVPFVQNPVLIKDKLLEFNQNF